MYPSNGYMIPLSEDEENTILVLAGDILTVNTLPKFKYFFDDISNRFHSIIYVMGNHEYYNSDFNKVPEYLKCGLKAYHNVHLLHNETVIIDQYKFIGSSLWVDFNNDPISELMVSNGLNDFHCIANFNVNVCKNEFVKNIDFLEKELYNTDYTNIVVTHHAPSYQSTDIRFKGSNLNPGFSSHLDEFVMLNKPDIWIHGHMHNTSDYQISDTRVICNPKGYYNENPEFKEFIIE